jgi:hypothetical protein
MIHVLCLTVYTSNTLETQPHGQYEYQVFTVYFHKCTKYIWAWRPLAAKVGTSKSRRKERQTTPKNFPGMQRTRAIRVA